MNIFILSEDPKKAAIMQCDKHIVKMVLETAQLLCSPYDPGSAPYKRTHYNHPCSLWARNSEGNFLWLCHHGLALSDEYTFRYNKEHASRKVIQWCYDNRKLLLLPKKRRTPFPLVMDDKHKRENAILSYRNFYKSEKSKFAKWEKSRKAPEWFFCSNLS